MMRFWPFQEKLETRADTYTDAVVSALLANASGDTDTRLGRTAIEEACRGLWGRAFASASFSPETTATRALTPHILNQIGRSLVTPGEAVFEIRVDSRLGRVVLVQADTWNISGDSLGWIYELALPEPTTTLTRTVTAERVVHVMYSTSPTEAWVGIGPLGEAADTHKLAGALETQLSREAQGPVGNLIEVPSTINTEKFQNDINKGLKGKVALVEGGNWQSGSVNSARADYTPKRLGMNAPASTDSLRNSVATDIAAACGVPPALLRPGDGTAAREAWRHFLYGAIALLARIVAAEIEFKLDAPGFEFNFDALFASDLSGRARAFQSMVGDGMDIDRAAALAGLLEA